MGTCVGGHGPNLSGYPGLTYAPNQHGEGVRFAHNGTPIDSALSEPSVADAIAALDAVAKKHGVKLPDLCDAIGFARNSEAI